MSHRQPEPSTQTTRTSRPRKHKNGFAGGFTPQQKIILALVGMLGFALLAVMGLFVLSMGPQQAPPVSIVPSETVEIPAQLLPPTWTTEPAATVLPSMTSHPATNAIPRLPASCADHGAGFDQGTAARVIDEKTIQVQVNGLSVNVSFAGIQVTGPSKETVIQHIQALVEGQTLLLVKDVSGEDPDGRLPRYIFAGEQFINYKLVRVGEAKVNKQSPDRACLDYFAAAEAQARAEKVGIWAPTLVPTRTFVPFVTLDPNKNGCDCSKRYMCSDFRTHEKAQACFNACNDYNSQLDEDRDGIACEGLP